MENCKDSKLLIRVWSTDGQAARHVYVPMYYDRENCIASILDWAAEGAKVEIALCDGEHGSKLVRIEAKVIREWKKVGEGKEKGER